MSDEVLCLDTSVLIKILVSEEPEELGDATQQLVLRALWKERLVAPAWAWAEVGSVLRKKVRMGLLQLGAKRPAYARDLAALSRG